MRHIVVSLCMLITALAGAGCVGGSDPVEPAATAGSTEATAEGGAAGLEPDVITDPVEALVGADAEVDAPMWEVGDGWNIIPHFGDAAAAPSTFVVTTASGSSYTLATTARDMAVYDAVYDVSYLGAIRASDLAGAQQGQPVRYFDFPLADGKTWSTTWDGLEVALTATYAAAIPTPLGDRPGFTIVGTTDGETYVEYDYVPALKWWSHMAFAAGYGFTVTEFGKDWVGTYVVATANQLVDQNTAAVAASPNTVTFTVAEGQEALLLDISGHASAHARGLFIVRPDGQPAMTDAENLAASGEPTDVAVTLQLEPLPGQWTVTAPVLHAPDGGFALRAFEAAVEERILR